VVNKTAAYDKIVTDLHCKNIVVSVRDRGRVRMREIRSRSPVPRRVYYQPNFGSKERCLVKKGKGKERHNAYKIADRVLSHIN